VRPRNLLVVSNGYGEDLEVTQVLRALPPDDLSITAYPLVGLGRAFPPDVAILDPRGEFPSGGFGLRAGWTTLRADLSQGWLGFWRAQRKTLRSQRGRADLVVAAGDVYCLTMASLAGGPTVFLELPRSEYIAPHSPIERWLIRRHACQVFTRDEVTAAGLRRRGIRAQCLGFTGMDTLAPSGETFGLAADRQVITLLPGSKPAAYDNVILLLQAAALAAGQTAPVPAVLVAWPPNLPRAGLGDAVTAAGGVWLDPDRFRFEGIDVLVTADRYADALHRATVVLGMAGAAHEQAAGLGKPVVAFPGTGPQFTQRFLREQQRLLGDALVVAATWQEAARAAAGLLGNPGERTRRGRIGMERQGAPGAAAAIAQYLLQRLSA